MSEKAIRVWLPCEKPVCFYPAYRRDELVGAGWHCPKCGERAEVGAGDDDRFFMCACGARLRIYLVPTLVELDPDG